MSHRLHPDELILTASSSKFQLFSALHLPFYLGIFLEQALGKPGEHNLPLPVSKTSYVQSAFGHTSSRRSNGLDPEY